MSILKWYPGAEELAFALGGRHIGKSWRALCPAHDDHSPSLSISERNGKTLFKCWSGCSQQAVLEALRSRQLWPEARRGPARVYTLVDEQEILAFIRSHERNLQRGIPTSTKAQRTYRQLQRVIYSPFTAEEVAEMHIFCAVFASDVRAGKALSPEDEKRFLAYLPHTLKMWMPNVW